MIDTSDVQDPEIVKLMEQYWTVIELMQNDCAKRGIKFFGMCYFRRWELWGEQIHWMYSNTDLVEYDRYLIEKYVKKIIKIDN